MAAKTDIRIIGIAGTSGAGKDTVGHILAREHGFLFVSVTDVLRSELRHRGVPVDREHLRELSAAWRREFGYGVLIDRALDTFTSALESGGYEGLAVASLRNPYEVDRVHELGGEVWWVDADIRLRYDRIRLNAATRARAEEDEKSFEQFQAEEAAEMHASGDAATLDMTAVQPKCDRELQNGGANIKQLEREIADIIEVEISRS